MSDDTTITGQLSVIDWIKIAISQTELPPTNAVLLNGYSERKDILEALESLALVHRQGGQLAAAQAWKDQVGRYIPDVAEIVNRPRMIFHISEFEKESPIEWLISDELPAKCLSVIYGQSGAAKTFLAIDYAAVVALTQNVIYIAGEGTSGYYARYHAWLKHCGHKKPGKFHLMPKALQLLRQSDIDAFIDEAKHLNPAVVFIDTLSRSMVGGDENNQKDMGLFVYGCDQIRERLGCAVVVVHHTGKYGDNERGSSVLRAAADMMIAVTNEEGIIKIACGKSKDTRPFNHRYCRLQEVTVQQNGAEVTSCVLEMWQKVRFDPEQLTTNQTRILECLASELFSEGVKAPDLKAYSNIQGSSFYTALNALMKRGFVTKKGRGARIDPVIITSKGMEWIRSKANPESMDSGMEL